MTGQDKRMSDDASDACGVEHRLGQRIKSCARTGLDYVLVAAINERP
jgi:hypothetical protein